MTTNSMDQTEPFSHVVAELMLNENNMDKRRPHERRQRHLQL